jgi:hypothetical protein
MSLYQRLKNVRSEEDVKDIYIKALGLKSYTKGLIDIRTQITPDNLKQVFDKWVDMIGREINGVDEDDYALLFFADIMHDGTVSTHANLLHKNNAPVFSLGGKIYQLGNNWQKNYIVWYLCCDVGNLDIKHSNPRNIYISTLGEADVDMMKATKTYVAAQRYQCDYLNDDITDDGEIDYSLTNKVPEGLRKAIAEGKKIMVLINPPYAESTSGGNTDTGAEAESKGGVAKTKFAATAMADYGKASNELLTQFVARIAQEIPTATLAMFGKLKYVDAVNL